MVSDANQGPGLVRLAVVATAGGPMHEVLGDQGVLVEVELGELLALIDHPLRRRNTAGFTLGPLVDEIIRGAREVSFTERMRLALAADLAGGQATLKTTAGRLSMSPRTLQRLLRERRTTFHRVVNETRCALAKQYLADESRGLGEVALLLGFSEQSAFQRAFRRWTGQTPASYRRGMGRA